MKIISRAEAKELGLKRYFTGVPCKRGHVCERYTGDSKCVECKAEEVAEWRAENKERAAEKAAVWYAKNKERKAEKAAAWRAENKEYEAGRKAAWRATNKERVAETNAAWRAANKERRAETKAAWRAANKERVAETDAAWRATNSGAVKAIKARRRSAKLLRTPVWSEVELIKEFYRDCPNGCHVDHIIPLQGKLVSGLHVLANLQYLPASENDSKGNKFDPWTFEA